jgi:hypothetical protein
MNDYSFTVGGLGSPAVFFETYDRGHFRIMTGSAMIWSETKMDSGSDR